MRLQRFLAQAGVASRRKAEEFIVAGRVRINGRVVTELGSQVDAAHDRVEFDGKPLATERHVYMLLHKPKGYVTTASDPEGRKTVFDLIGERGTRIYAVGRLDYTTEGLLLLTNDGDLAHALMHPSRGAEKIYHAKLQGLVTREEMIELSRGVTLDDGTRTQPCDVGDVGTTGKHSWVEFRLREGKNRQIHRMVETIGRRVLKLIRVAYSGLTLEGLDIGKWRHLESHEVARLRRQAGLETKSSPATLPARQPFDKLKASRSKSQRPRVRRDRQN